MPNAVAAFAEATAERKRSPRRFFQDLMPKFLRTVQYKTNWDPHGEFAKYLPQGEAPADALKDLSTKENALSIWEIDDRGENLDRVLAAIASCRDHIQKIDYVIVDSKHLEDLALAREKKAGATHDEHANATWHFDLINLSAGDLGRLANRMLMHGTPERIQDKKLLPLLGKSIENKFVNRQDLHQNLRAKFVEH